MNDATRHLQTYQEAWKKILSMKGQEVECMHATDGRLVWKIVDSVDEDVFRSTRKREEKLFESKYVPVIDEDDIPTDDYSRTFWNLWAKHIDEDLIKLNVAIQKNNITRKKNLQKAIKEVSKSEFIIFHALLIGASLYSSQGFKLWCDPTYIDVIIKNKKRRYRRFSEHVDFGKYMKLWRFKQIKFFKVLSCFYVLLI